MVGVDISDRSIKVAEIIGHETPKLKTVCWSGLSPDVIKRGVIQDVAVVADALKNALVQCSPVSIEGKIVVASIPETQSFVRMIDLPVMPEHEMDEAVQWAIKQHIPFDLDRVYLDWQPLQVFSEKDQERKHVLVGAAQREVVDPLLMVLDAVGLNVAALELEAQAIVRSLLPTDTSGINGVLIVDLGATNTNIIFFDEGMMKFTANVQMGGDDFTAKLAHDLKIAPEEAAEKKASIGAVSKGGDKAVSESLHDSILLLTKQVQTVVQEMIVQTKGNPSVKTILLSGGSANLPGIVDVVSEAFTDIPVQRGNPWTNIYLEDDKKSASLTNLDATHFVTALGLALRRIDYVS